MSFAHNEWEEATSDMHKESEVSIYDEMLSLYALKNRLFRFRYAINNNGIAEATLDSIVHYLSNRYTYSSFNDWSSYMDRESVDFLGMC